ncbi:hypothetical protein ES703_16524 [subsurface metagenome]
MLAPEKTIREFFRALFRGEIDSLKEFVSVFNPVWDGFSDGGSGGVGTSGSSGGEGGTSPAWYGLVPNAHSTWLGDVKVEDLVIIYDTSGEDSGGHGGDGGLYYVPHLDDWTDLFSPDDVKIDAGRGGNGMPGLHGKGGTGGVTLSLQGYGEDFTWQGESGNFGQGSTHGSGGGGGGGGYPDVVKVLIWLYIPLSGGGGGGGGSGGCGVSGGKGGFAGGNSFGISLISSSPLIAWNTIGTQDGGDGGEGGRGGNGGAGGIGGSGGDGEELGFRILIFGFFDALSGDGKRGGDGGAGGSGGGAGGGRGGDACPIYYDNSEDPWGDSDPVIMGNCVEYDGVMGVDLDPDAYGTYPFLIGDGGKGGKGGSSSGGNESEGKSGEDGIGCRPGIDEYDNENITIDNEDPPVTQVIDIPIDFEGTTIVGLNIDTGVLEDIDLLSSWDGSDVVMTLISPSGMIIDRDTTDPDVSHLKGPTYEFYGINNPELGYWTIQLYGADVPDEGENVALTITKRHANIPPIARCQDVEVVAGYDGMADASIDMGSYDPDRDSISIIQTPIGPYTLGETLVTLLIEDVHGASDTCQATVKVVDKTPPDIRCPDTVFLTSDENGQATASFSATATDNCDSSLIITSDAPALYPLGITNVTFTATDAAGNTAICTTMVTVVDITQPLQALLPPILSDLSITPSDVELGDNVTIGFDIENIDNQSFIYMVIMHIENVAFPPPSRTPYNVSLMIDVELEAYESKTVSHTITLDTVGNYNVTVNGLTGSFTVKAPPKPAEFEISDLIISPGEVEEGEAVTVSVDVTNVGEEMGGYTVELVLDGVVVGSEEITPLEGGLTATVSFDVTRNEGTYQVEVEGLTGSFIVNPEPSFWDKYGLIILGLIAVIIIILWRLRKF